MEEINPETPKQQDIVDIEETVNKSADSADDLVEHTENENFVANEDVVVDTPDIEPTNIENEPNIPDPELEQKSSKLLLYGILGVIAIFALIFAVGYLYDTKFIDTVDPITGHSTVYPSENCYTYKDNEFCEVDGIWYTDFRQGNTIFTGVGFHNDPDSVADIEIEGMISNNFINSDIFYVTFDPTKENLGYTALASAELQLSMGRAMRLPLKAACTKEHPDCEQVEIITCNSTEKAVFFIDEQPETKILFEDNCITITGQGEELVRAVDRLLFFWYGIMV